MSTHVWVDVECPILFWSEIFPFWALVFLGILFFLRLFLFFLSTLLWVDVECPIFFWSDIFPFWDLVFFSILKYFFSAFWEFHVYSYLSGFGTPYFFFGSSFFHSNTYWLYTDRYFFKISESGSLKGQDQPVRKRKRSEVLIEEASLINLSNDNEDSKKDK